MDPQPSINKPDYSNQSQPFIPEKRSVSPIFIIVGLLVALMVGAGGMYLWQKYPELRPIQLPPQGKACTMEAKLCPDGSSVGRVPPDCEFAPCLSTEPLPTSLASPVSTVSGQPQSQVPSDWKTYKPNINGLNFSFKYPENWKLKEPVSPQDINIAYIYSDKIINIGEPEGLNYYLYISPTKGLPEVEFAKEIINGYSAYKTDRLPSRSGSLSYFITNNEKNYISVSFAPYNINQPFPEQDQYVQTFIQILSTLKFLDSSTEGQFCGGFAGIACPEGYKCQLDGNYPDAGGKCVKL